jgi:thiamine biosynthesis lipoprotein
LLTLKKCRSVALSVLMVFTGVGACSPESGYQSIQGATMGTYYKVQFKNGGQCVSSQAAVDAQLLAFNQSLSTYMEGSEITIFNNDLGSNFTPVSNRFGSVVEAATSVWEQSDGAFDVTVGPLVNLWGFGPADSGDFPSSAAQTAAFASVGMQNLELQRTREGSVEVFSVRKNVPGLYVDFSALAKGLGVDEVAQSLVALGCGDFMVDIGGEVRTMGLSPKARPWRIGIEAPDATRRGIIQRVLQLTNQSVATSGDYRNFRVVDGVRVDHVVDPRSGKPADNSVVSVTVVHEQAMWADAYATALMVLGADAGIQMAEKLGLAVLVITKTSDDRFVERYTPSMTQFFLEFPE